MSFNVKKTTTACAVAAALFAASWGAHAGEPIPNPGQATVKFTATVTNQTCTPEWSGTDGVSIAFGNVSKSALEKSGDVGLTKPFSLSLKECSGVTGVVVSAGGVADTGFATAFANTATGSSAAKNVGFVLLGGDKQDTVMTPNDVTSTVEYNLPSTTTGEGEDAVTTYADHITMPFLAEFVATADTATAGTAEGEGTLYLSYK